MSKKLKFSLDFETTTTPDDVRIWAWGSEEIGNPENFEYGTDMEGFIEYAKKCNGDIYFHNLAFDGEFIVNYLLHNGYRFSRNNEPHTFDGVISNMNQWYMLDITFGYTKKKRHFVRIYDSLKKLPFKVQQLSKAFGLSDMKGEIDYDKPRPIGYEPTFEELAYLKNDVSIVAQSLKVQFDNGFKKMTIGSDAMQEIKDIMGSGQFKNYFPVLSKELDDNIRLAYRGGWTWLNPAYADKDVGCGIVYDVNSLYPAQMRDRLLPVGMPYPFEGKYEEDKLYPLYIQHVKAMFELKEDHVPTIQVKNSKWFQPEEYLKSSDGLMIDLYMTNMDMELFLAHYDILEIEYCSGWKFQGRKNLFNQFIDKNMLTKETSEGALRTLAKLILNNAYGKFATNPDITGKIPYLKEDGSTGYHAENGYYEKDENGVEKWVLDEELKEYKDPVYTAMGVFITSWGRYTTITAAQSVYPERFIYADTDSIHLVGTEEPPELDGQIHDSKIGLWKSEGEFRRARFLRAKTYIEEKEGKNGEWELEVKCAGLPDKAKKEVTWENFHVGFKTDKKLLKRRFKGGVVLMPTEFTIM